MSGPVEGERAHCSRTICFIGFSFGQNTVKAFHLDQVAKRREAAVQLVKILLPDS